MGPAGAGLWRSPGIVALVGLMAAQILTAVAVAYLLGAPRVLPPLLEDKAVTGGGLNVWLHPWRRCLG